MIRREYFDKYEQLQLQLQIVETQQTKLQLREEELKKWYYNNHFLQIK